MPILDPPASAVSRDQPDFFSRRVRSAQRFYLNLAPRSDTPLAVVCGGYEECSSDYVIRRADFPHFALEWIVGGRGRFRCGSAEWANLRGGAIFAYQPHLRHEIEVDPEQPLVKHFVCFAGCDALALLRTARLDSGNVIAASPGADISRAFENLLVDGVRSDSSADELCAAQLRYMLLKIGSTGASPTSADSSAHATYLRCDKHLSAHAEHLLSLSQFATECGVSEEYLCRLYKRFSQQTPYQRLVRMRMSIAAGRLASGSTTIKLVAAELGYDDPFHFSRCFKRALGLSPSEFRRLHS